MKTIIASIMSVAFATFSLSANSSAAEKTMSKEVTLTGTATCAKCGLHMADKCASVLQVKNEGKTTTYYLTGSLADHAWHKANVCKDSKKMTITGSVSEKDGKKMLDVTKAVDAK